jgi:hypothetical protein
MEPALAEALERETPRRRITVLLTEAERSALEVIARRGYRDLRDALRLLVRQEAQRQGLLEAEGSEGARNVDWK